MNATQHDYRHRSMKKKAPQHGKKSTATWKKPVRQHGKSTANGKSTATWKKHRNISTSTR
jgi:hypothetical protein